MLTSDTYHLPTSLREALELWSSAVVGSRLVAGATDLLPWAREGRAGDVHVPELVDITRIPELDGYCHEEGRLRLGANLVFQQFLTDRTLVGLLPCMPHCAVWFADDQIREQATLVGNLVNASPAADGTPAVVVLNGEVELARLKSGQIVRRRLVIDDFIKGPGETEIASDEIVTAVIVDKADGYGGAFKKVGLRRSLVIAVACCAALVKSDESGKRFKDVRLALGGVGPRPIRMDSAEKMLRGQPISCATIRRASLLAAEKVASRSRQTYRREVVVNFVRAALEDALRNLPGFEIKLNNRSESVYA